jgi:hypothetical protein
VKDKAASDKETVRISFMGSPRASAKRMVRVLPGTRRLRVPGV